MAWTLVEQRGRKRIVARFDGHLSDVEGRESAQRFFDTVGSTSWHIVFDVRAMDGYTSTARRCWQRTLGPKRSQLLSLTVVGGGPIVRMGAAALGLALGVPARNTKSLD